MRLLGAVMSAEKTLPWGRRVSIALGIVLLCCASSVARSVAAFYDFYNRWD
jgi:hypothetical protein